jgi:2-dehydro-3-deoxyphosphogluconate aldolase/(4S)-4-hydroxy-2-oxoglutarate aldolase
MSAILSVDELMAVQPVIPVLTVHRVEDATPLAETLVEAGLRVLEITMRTPVALDVMRAMAGVPGAIVGAGTALSARDVEAAAAAGATFIVTPGLSEATLRSAKEAGLPLLPGVATATEIMAGLELGLDRFKFFPAEQAGGLAMLGAFEGPFGKVKFCPTGGVRQDTAEAYLRRPNVAVVGGGWIAPADLVRAGSWDEIGRIAREAAALPRPTRSH